MKRWVRKPKLLPLCGIGFFVGILLCLFCGQGDGCLRTESRLQVQARTEDGGKLLFSLLFIRGKWIVLLLLAATTYLAPICCGMTASWMGWSLGAFLTMALRQYHLKGVLLLPAALLPQWLFYAPATWLLLKWCMSFYEGIYLKQKLSKKACLASLFLLLAMMGMGIYLESFWNPKILHGILERF